MTPFGCRLAWTLTFALGEALANSSVEGGSCHTINCGLGFVFGLAFTGGAAGEHGAFAGLGSALGISVAYRSVCRGSDRDRSRPVTEQVPPIVKMAIILAPRCGRFPWTLNHQGFAFDRWIQCWVRKVDVYAR